MCKYICEDILHSPFLLLDNGFLLKKNDESFKKEKRRDALAGPVRAAFTGLQRLRNGELAFFIAGLTEAAIDLRWLRLLIPDTQGVSGGCS